MITKVYYALATGNFTDSSTQGLLVNEFNFPAPAVKTQYVDVPGRDGLIDLSESLTGEPVYQNVKGSITFIVLKGANFNLDTFINTYHGKIMRFYTDEQPNYYRIGRATVTGKTLRLGKLQTFTVSVDADPLLWALAETESQYAISNADTISTWTKTSAKNATVTVTPSTNTITLRKSGYSDNCSARFSVPVVPNTRYIFSSTPSSLSSGAGNGYYTVEVGGVVVDAEYFDSGNNSVIYINLYAQGSNSLWDVSFTNNILAIANSIASSGVKFTVPTFRATQDCIAIVNGTQMALTANADTPNFELNLRETNNSVAFVGSNGGTVTMRYRSGVLA